MLHCATFNNDYSSDDNADDDNDDEDENDDDDDEEMERRTMTTTTQTMTMTMIKIMTSIITAMPGYLETKDVIIPFFVSFFL